MPIIREARRLAADDIGRYISIPKWHDPESEHHEGLGRPKLITGLDANAKTITVRRGGGMALSLKYGDQVMISGAPSCPTR